MSAWAATQELLDTDAADEIDGLFEDLKDCSKNSLWKFENTQ